MEETKQETLPIPCTPIFDTLSRTVELGNNQTGRIAEFLKEYATEHPHKTTAKLRELTLEIREKPSGVEYHFKADGEVFGIKFNGLNQLDAENTVAAKIWQLIFAKIIQSGHCTKEGYMQNPQIILSTVELVALGIFQSANSATTHLKDIIRKLQTITIRVSTKDKESYHVLIPDVDVDKQCQHWSLTFNPKLPCWFYFVHYYCRFPIAGFQLSCKAFALLRYIMLLLNLNRGKITKQGYFVLTADSLIERLRLNRKDKHKKDALLKPVIKALREINTTEDIDVRAVFDTLDEDTTALLNNVLSLPPETLDTEINKMLSDKALKVPVALEGRIKIYVQPTLLRKWALPKNNTKALPRKKKQGEDLHQASQNLHQLSQNLHHASQNLHQVSHSDFTQPI